MDSLIETDTTTSWFWNEHFWLPDGVNWTDLSSNSSVNYPQFRDLKHTITVGILLLALRIITESFVFVPVGYALGWISPKKGGLWTRIYGHLSHGFHSRSKFKSVAETAWRFTYYTSAWIYGFLILRTQPHFTDTEECFRDWPYHPIADAVWWYYIVSTGFYWSLLVSQFLFDIRRSDFVEMMLHHIVTIFLLSMSFGTNFVRAGSLILFIHDTADIYLELGKMFRYADRESGEGRTYWSTLLTVDFALLLVVWIGTRLYYFPAHIIRTMLFEGPRLVQENYLWTNLLQRPIVPRVFLAMLCTLLVLHLYWTTLLLKITWKALGSTDRSSVNDIREDEECLSDENDDDDVFVEDEDEDNNDDKDKDKITNAAAVAAVENNKSRQRSKNSGANIVRNGSVKTAESSSTLLSKSDGRSRKKVQ